MYFRQKKRKLLNGSACKAKKTLLKQYLMRFGFLEGPCALLLSLALRETPFNQSSAIKTLRVITGAYV